MILSKTFSLKNKTNDVKQLASFNYHLFFHIFTTFLTFPCFFSITSLNRITLINKKFNMIEQE